ncbi:hypothetical protein FQN53_006581 [Emmonsiellopsis sp. PD_33]|nr:hypothetical protein FQN53_006581 [Emmonsiellopsis sp. PD_33]
MSIWTAAQSGKLTKGMLLDFLDQDRDILNREDASGITPLGYALLKGKASVVKLLLDNNSDPDKPMGESIDFPDGRTPIYLASIAKPPNPRMVQLLLEKGTKTVDQPIAAYKNETPLMAAISRTKNPEIVKLLVNKGASPDAKNSDGKTARDLADALSDPSTKKKIKDALEPTLKKGGGRGGLQSYMTKWVVGVLSRFKSWKTLGFIFKSASQYFLNIAPRASFYPEEEIEEREPQTAADFKVNLENVVNSEGLGRFFPPGSTYLNEVAQKAISLKDDPDNRLNSPSQLKGLATMALYQPILYCDDSASMGVKENSDSVGEDRWTKQREIVKRITDVATRADPNNRGVYFRLINRYTPNADNLDGKAVEQILLSRTPDCSTPLGTKLRERILNPVIFEPLNAGKRLERPYLIMIITDGCPYGEDEDELRKAILECSSFLGSKGYRKDAVRFCLCQIGTDDDAKVFMNKLDMDDQVLEVLYRTSELLDARYDELRQNEAELEDWLLAMLLSPVQVLNAE